jgi:hypothetical protein
MNMLWHEMDSVLHGDPAVMTHMPFLALGLRAAPVLFYCRSGRGDLHPLSGSRVWKLAAATGIGGSIAAVRALDTGFAADVCECSPAGWRDEAGWHVTFVAGGGACGDPRFRLYRMDGSDLRHLGAPAYVLPASAGFQHRERLVHAVTGDRVHVREPGGDREIDLPGRFIYRVSYRADDPDVLLITGQPHAGGDVFTIEHDLRSGEQRLLECDGTPAYKPTLLGDTMLYAEKIGEGFESRRIRRGTPSRRAMV